MLQRIPKASSLLVRRLTTTLTATATATTSTNNILLLLPASSCRLTTPASQSQQRHHPLTSHQNQNQRRSYYGNDDNGHDWWRTNKQKESNKKVVVRKPGSKAFVNDIEDSAVMDLFFKYAQQQTGEGQPSLDLAGVHSLLEGIGESHDDATVRELFAGADVDDSGCVDLEEFLVAADKFLGSSPARIVLIVGGPGSGKGTIAARMAKEAGLVHLSSGDLLRSEVERCTPMGKQVKEIMARGELISSEIIVALVRRRMRDHPGKRVLLDGFPRSLENAVDLVKLCGKPELALHLECDDTILMERIMARGEKSNRADDNFHTALKRLRTYHKFHLPTIQFLREQHVPIVELDCSVAPDLVWEQLMAIGRVMRPAVKIPQLDDEDDIPYGDAIRVAQVRKASKTTWTK